MSVYMDTKLFGKEVRDLRVKAGLTQIALAERAGVNRKTVLDIEAGEPVRVDSLHRVLLGLGMEITMRPIKRQIPTLDDMVAENEQEDLDGERP